MTNEDKKIWGIHIQDDNLFFKDMFCIVEG